MLTTPTTLPAHTAAFVMLAQYRSDFRGSVVRALGPTLAPTAQWSNSTIPTLRNVVDLLPASMRASPLWRAATRNNSADSPLDRTDGNYEPTLARISRVTPPTVCAMSRAFADVIVPLGTAPGTRIKAWRNWCTCLTWAIGRHSTDKILPMHSDVLHAMLWDFTAMGASKSTLKSIVDSVIARHRPSSRPLWPATCRTSASPDAWAASWGHSIPTRWGSHGT